MTGTTAPRRDAVRNRQRILDVAAEAVADGRGLQLNEVARRAGIGVATVYRHFPTPTALLEALARPGLDRLLAHGRDALAGDDPGEGLGGFLAAGLRAQLADPALEAVFGSTQQDGSAPLGSETRESIAELRRILTALFDRARRAGSVRPTIDADDLFPLMCGVAYACRLQRAASAGTGDDVPDRYLAALLDGIRAR